MILTELYIIDGIYRIVWMHFYTFIHRFGQQVIDNVNIYFIWY